MLVGSDVGEKLLEVAAGEVAARYKHAGGKIHEADEVEIKVPSGTIVYKIVSIT